MKAVISLLAVFWAAGCATQGPHLRDREFVGEFVCEGDWLGHGATMCLNEDRSCAMRTRGGEDDGKVFASGHWAKKGKKIIVVLPGEEIVFSVSRAKEFVALTWAVDQRNHLDFRFVKPWPSAPNQPSEPTP